MEKRKEKEKRPKNESLKFQKIVQASRLLFKSSLSASSVFIKWKQLTSTQNVEWDSQSRPQIPLTFENFEA